MQDQSISVDLTTNCITISGTEIKLPPQEAELAFVLAKAMPNGARRGAIIIAIWGDCERSNPDIHIRVLAGKLRRKLAPHNVAVMHVQDVGYRLAVGVQRTGHRTYAAVPHAA